MVSLRSSIASLLKQLAQKVSHQDEIETQDRLEDIENNIQLLIEEIGEVGVLCDKCGGEGCFKCGNSGVVKRKQLFGWPW